MKYYYTFLLTVCTLFFADAQEIIRSTVIDDTNLLISAKATSVNNVTFTLEPSIDFDKENVGFEFPITFKVSPFNLQTFRSKFEDYLEKLNNYNKTYLLNNELENFKKDKNIDETKISELIKQLFSDEDLKKYFSTIEITISNLKTEYSNHNPSKKKEIKDIIKKRITEKTKGKIQVFKDNFSDDLQAEKDFDAKTRIRNRIERLYNYFDAQIVLLFKYDTEPVAGTLNYNLDNIEVQYFDNRSYETYFENRKRDYHNLIQKLYRLRLHSKKRLMIKAKKTQSPLTEQYVLNDILKKDSVLLETENKVITKILEKDATLTADQKEIIKKIFNEISIIPEEEKNVIINILERNSESSIITKADKEVIEENLKARFNMKDLKNAQLLTIIDHFSKNAREYKSKYINDPELFLEHFKDVINNFRIYHPSKRKSLIYQKLLELKNRESYDNVCIELHEILPLENELNSLYDNVKEPERKKLSLSTNIFIKEKKKKSLKNELTSIEKKINELLNRRNDFKDEKEKKEKEKDSLTSFQLILKISKSSLLINLNNDFLSKIDKIINHTEQRKSQLDSEINSLKNKIVDKKSEITTQIDDKKNTKKNLADVEKIIAKEKIDLRNREKEISDYYKKIRKLNKKIGVKLLKIAEDYQNTPLWNLNVNNIELNINDGFIEGITVVGKLETKLDTNIGCDKKLLEKFKKILKEKSFFDEEIKFKNSFPFGFSSSKDFDDFKNYELCVYVGKHKQFTLKIKDVFPEYIEGLQNDRLDFSPKDQVVRIERGEENTKGKIVLKKEKSSKLFTIAVYTDFIGFSDNESNGTLQFEFEKMMPLYTKRNTWRFGERYISRGLNYGYFNFIKPQFRWARLDANDDSENLKLETLEVFQGNTSETIKYVTLLDLFRYENISVGTDLNLLSVDLPTAKTRFEINFGGRYGRTRVLDTNGNPNITETVNGEEKSTIVNTYEINTWRFYPEFTFRLRPDERYGASVSFRPIRFNTDTRNFSSVTSVEKFTNTLNDRQLWLHQVEINAHFAPSSQRDNTFFFRYRYTNNADWQGNGFGEIQVGYSMALKL